MKSIAKLFQMGIVVLISIKKKLVLIFSEEKEKEKRMVFCSNLNIKF